MIKFQLSKSNSQYKNAGKLTWNISLALLLSAFGFLPNYSGAQSLPITDFSVFGGNGSCPTGQGQNPPPSPGCAVQISSYGNISGGKVGSYNLVKTTGPVTFGGNIHSGRTITLSSYNTVNGNMTAANSSSASGTIVSVGSNAAINGNIDVNGNSTVTSGYVTGYVIHPAGKTYTGPLPGGGNLTGIPTLPTLPAMPAITTFPAYGTTNLTTTTTINPGAYKDVALTGNKTLTFNGPGIYIFKSINNYGSSFNTFKFNFQNATTGNFIIYVHGNVDLDDHKTTFQNGGSASRIFMEIHGNGSGCYWGNYAFDMDYGISNFSGTVWAPYAGIHTGGGSGCIPSITGALYSGTQVNLGINTTVVYAPFIQCTTPNANAGPDKKLSCWLTKVNLLGSSNSSNASYNWVASNGGHIFSGATTSSPVVDAIGTYTLTITVPGGCTATDVALVTFGPCILPYYPPPNGGISTLLKGAELTSLNQNPGIEDTIGNIFNLIEDSVWIEIITIQGQTQNCLNVVSQSPQYGLTNLVNNGPGSLILTGKFPIVNLQKLDSLPTLINFVRPLFPAVSSSGVANTPGDIVQKSDFARNGFNLKGEGIKVGVISDSYNSILGNPALTDVQNGDLPGAGNSQYSNPVNVLQEFPFGVRSDEGRAMLQIVHDVAPAAKLDFASGFVSPNNMAVMINQLVQDTCKVIIDDVTHITEPFLQDGVIAQAANAAAAQGVSYFSAAGNVASKSTQATFNPMPAPLGIPGFAHNFNGAGDAFQQISLTPGVYTIVLQWVDSIYSIGQTQTGTQNDMNIFLVDEAGTTLFGMNRDNSSGDPHEVLSFTVVGGNATANLVITKTSGPTNPIFKWIAFRGDVIISEYGNGPTIVGQANALGAMAVGAVRYNKTQSYGFNPPELETFSSTGGTPVNGVVRNKPDFCAPDGVNTTVAFGSLNIEGDAFPNFFGTSCSAPHAGAGAALLMSAKKKFYNLDISAPAMKSLLQSTATDMGTPGFDFSSGSGFVDIGAAMLTFAAPTPVIDSLGYSSSIVPGTQQFTVSTNGDFLTTGSVIIFRDDTLETTFISTNQLTASIPPFFGNPPIYVYTPPITPSGDDGGNSDTLYFFTPVKKNVVVTAINKTKRYGEILPVFTATITVNGVSYNLSGDPLDTLGLADLSFQTPATSTSNVGIYFIQPAANVSDPGLQELYNYTFTNGLLTIDKMPLTITARDTTVTYGDEINGLLMHYNYSYDNSLIPPSEQTAFFNSIISGHLANMDEVVALVDDQIAVNQRTISSSDLVNLSFIASQRTISSQRSISSQRTISSTVIFDTTRIVDLGPAAVFNFQVDDANVTLVTAGPMANQRTISSQRAISSGLTVVNQRAISSGSIIVNSTPPDSSSGAQVAVILDEGDYNAPPEDTIYIFKSVNMITGVEAGTHWIVPGAFLTNNFDITYAFGILTVLPVPPCACSNCNGNTIIVNQNVTVNLGTNPPTLVSCDPDLLPYFTYDKSGATADLWKAIFDVGPNKILIKNGVTITNSNCSGFAPGVFFKGTCDFEMENGGHLVLNSSNKNSGKISVEVDGNIIINGEIRNQVSGTMGLVGPVTVSSRCGDINVGQTGQVFDLGIDAGGSDISLFTCGMDICTSAGHTPGNITISGLVKSYAHAHAGNLTLNRPNIKVVSFNGSITVNANTSEPLYDEFSSNGAKYDIYGGLLSWVRDNVNPGKVEVQAKNNITVNGHGTDPTGTVRKSFGAIAAIATASNSPGGLVDVRSTEGSIIANNRSFDVSGRNLLSTNFANIKLNAKQNIVLTRSGASSSFNPVVDASAPSSGSKGGLNVLRAYSGNISIGANALVSASVPAGSGTVQGINQLISCSGITNSGSITPADLTTSNDIGTCSPVAPSSLFIDCTTSGIARMEGSENVEEEMTGSMLGSSYPNPFSSTTTINYRLENNMFATVKIIDLMGNVVATLVNSNQAAGEHQIEWNAANAAAGTYYIRLEAGEYFSNKKLILIK